MLTTLKSLHEEYCVLDLVSNAFEELKRNSDLIVFEMKQ